ncbi:MAG: hypothetical protein ACI870_000160 [Crocinitomicaceae bacterium]|jgi:hypothetical protein
MKKIFLLILITLSVPAVIFAQSSNIGIIKGIWFSEDVFFAGDPIRIYTAIQNNSGDDIEGVVEFYDNGISIGKKSFKSLDRRISELWIDTLISEGTHDYSVTITEASINSPGEVLVTITPQVITTDNTISADLDTDGDNIGNKIDQDDDGDGFNDKQEKKEGTDPLDSYSKPQPKITELNNESPDKNTSIIQSILDIINQPDEGLSQSKDTENIETVDLYNSEYFINLEELYLIVAKLITPLNNFKNTVSPRVEKERLRIIEKIESNDISQKSAPISKDTDIESLTNFDYGLTGWTQFFDTLYSWVLFGIRLVISCLPCMIILIFVVIHIILKLIFNIFGKRKNRRIG